jgi:hypothetical protein
MSPLSAPLDVSRLLNFPRYGLSPTQRLVRIHKSTREPWWFSNTGLLRFDLAPPDGTCYLAEEAIGAFVEVFQDWITAPIPIPIEEVLARSESHIGVPRMMVLADCTNPRALSFGVTAEIHSASDRAMSQRWAIAFRSAGFDGVRYFVRHDPGQRQTAIALFGDAGLHDWPVEVTQPISAETIVGAERVFGITVL